MKRRFLLAVLLCACAHEQLVPEEAELAKEQPATFAEGTVPPVRKRCRKGGPRLGERDRASGRLVLDYVITEEGKVKDISEFLYEIEAAPPKGNYNHTVAYHDACHLAHGQKITTAPREVLKVHVIIAKTQQTRGEDRDIWGCARVLGGQNVLVDARV